QLELGWLFNRQIGCSRSLRYPVNVFSSSSEHGGKTYAVGKENTRFDPFSQTQHPCKFLPKNEIPQALSGAVKRGRDRQNKSRAMIRRSMCQSCFVIMGLFPQFDASQL